MFGDLCHNNIRNLTAVVHQYQTSFNQSTQTELCSEINIHFNNTIREGSEGLNPDREDW